MGTQDLIGNDPVFGVSEFVAVFNQSIEVMYPSVVIVGELSSFRISRGRWVYFDLKDDISSVGFFGSVLALPGPLEDGLVLEVTGRPKLHPNYGFNINVDSIKVSGEGSIKKAQDLLARKLMAEGLFDDARKRALPYPPQDVGVISSEKSAALADFRKIINARWGKLDVRLADVQVQGADAPKQIIRAITEFNELKSPPEVLVIIRGGGSADDLAAYSTEPVVRAVAASRIPTLVAIGHEVDVSLAELAADRRASTPSNAAEILVPDARSEKVYLNSQAKKLSYLTEQITNLAHRELELNTKLLSDLARNVFLASIKDLKLAQDMLRVLDPKAPLARGYALVNGLEGRITSYKQVKPGQQINVELGDGMIDSEVKKAKKK